MTDYDTQQSLRTLEKTIAEDRTVSRTTRNVEWIPLERMPSKPPKVEPIRRRYPRIGRNAPCPCGSGLKLKYCHGAM